MRAPARRGGGWRRLIAVWLGAMLFELAWTSGLLDQVPAGASASHRPNGSSAQARDRLSRIPAPVRSRDAATFGICHRGPSRGSGANCVVDGDTFHIGGEKIRIAGIDAPETHPSHCAEDARLGQDATKRLYALLNAGPVRLSPIDRDRDRYGRLLRNVSVDGSDVGAAMIADGVARPYGHGRRPWCE